MQKSFKDSRGLRDSYFILDKSAEFMTFSKDPEKDSEIHAALSSLNWPAWLKAKASVLLFENCIS